jgi:hypothetical protein
MILEQGVESAPPRPMAIAKFVPWPWNAASGKGILRNGLILRHKRFNLRYLSPGVIAFAGFENQPARQLDRCLALVAGWPAGVVADGRSPLVGRYVAAAGYRGR